MRHFVIAFVVASAGSVLADEDLSKYGDTPAQQFSRKADELSAQGKMGPAMTYGYSGEVVLPIALTSPTALAPNTSTAKHSFRRMGTIEPPRQPIDNGSSACVRSS